MRSLAIIFIFISTVTFGQFTKTQLHQGVTNNIRPGLTPFKVGNQLDSMIHSFQLQLSGTGFVKASGTTISYDNSTYITGNQTITLSGDVTGSGTTGIAATVVRINGTSLAGLATGILKNTTSTGVPSIAVAGDFPTLNQNTTGSAATWTTGRTIGITGDVTWTSPSLNGSTNVTAAATVTRINGTALSGLATGILKNTTSTGVPSIATAGTDYYNPGGTDVAVADGGTNISSYAIGDLLQATGTTTLAKLASVSAGSFLRSGGVTTASAWSTVKIPNTISAGSIWLANSANTITEVTPGVGQSVRWNSGGTAWEAFTPASGISNSATNTELMKSDGTNAVSSGLFASSSIPFQYTNGVAAFQIINNSGSGNWGFDTGSNGIFTLGGTTGVVTSKINTATYVNAGSVTSLLITTGDAFSNNNNSGNLYLSTGAKNGSGLQGNIGLFTSTGSFGAAEKALFWNNVTTAPTTSVTGGGVMYSSSGFPYWWTGTSLYSMSDKGTSTNDAAIAGSIGEEMNSTVSAYTNYTTTATYQNVASIALTAGDWDLSAFATYSSNSATITAAANAIFVISTTTASASGATEGLNIMYIPQAALLGTSKFSDAIAPYRVSISGTTTYYLNTQATFTIGNPQYTGTIRARRIR